jgi:catechol 2,3-dioxygenase-like lactoylglutathione lyase family enzyme
MSNWKLVQMTYKVNHLKSTLRFFQENFNFKILNHNEFNEPFKYSKTQIGFEDSKFKIELLENHGIFEYENKPNGYQCIHVISKDYNGNKDVVFDLENDQKFEVKKDEIDEIYQIDLFTKNIEKSKEFYTKTLKMNLFHQDSQKILVGFHENETKLCLILNEEYTANKNVLMSIDGDIGCMIDPDGHRISKFVQKQGNNYVDWLERKSKRKLKLRYSLIVLFLVFVFIRPNDLLLGY